MLELSLLVTLAAGAAPPSVCDLVDRAAVVGLLGSAATAGTPAGPERDDDTGGTMSYCTFRSGPTALIVSRIAFASGAAASKATTKELVASRLDGDGTAVTEEPGLGDKAFWAANSQGAEFVVLKGPVVLAVALGGRPANPPASYRRALRAAVAAALAKL